MRGFTRLPHATWIGELVVFFTVSAVRRTVNRPVEKNISAWKLVWLNNPDQNDHHKRPSLNYLKYNIWNNLIQKYTCKHYCSPYICNVMHGNDLYVLGNGINIALLSIGTNSQNSSRYSILDWMQISIRSDKLKS